MWLVDSASFINLSDGVFVTFYVLFGALTLVISWLVLKASDRTSVRPLPPVPSDPDPIEMAHLAGGENNVIRLVLYNLLQRGLIEIDAESRLRPTQPTAPGGLTMLEKHVLDAVQSTPRTKDFFKDASLQSMVREACAPLRTQLQAEQLLLPQSVSLAGKRVLRIGFSAFIGLVLCSELLAWSQGTTNALYLLIPMLFACGCLSILVGKVTDGWLSKRGRAYLAQVRLAYSNVKTDALSGYGTAPRVPERSASAISNALPLLIGLYGFEILLGTSDASVAKAFQVGSDASSGACGAGGCGGSGCGGCGGGCGGGG